MMLGYQFPLFQKRTFGGNWHCDRFLQARYPSYHATNSVKALKETESTGSNHWPCLIFPSSTTGPLMEDVWSMPKHHYSAVTATTTTSFGFCFTGFLRQCYSRLCGVPKTYIHTSPCVHEPLRTGAGILQAGESASQPHNGVKPLNGTESTEANQRK